MEIEKIKPIEKFDIRITMSSKECEKLREDFEKLHEINGYEHLSLWDKCKTLSELDDLLK